MSMMSRPEWKQLVKRGDLLKHLESQIPGFDIRGKQNSLLMRVLSLLLFFNKRFMDSYVTTVYPRIYVPSWWGKSKHRWKAEMEILAHEYVHLRDRKKLGWAFNLLYLSPQIFSLLAIGAVWNLWFLLALVFLLPWPSPGRAWLEFRGYRMSLAIKYWTLVERKVNEEKLYTFVEKYDITWVVDQFTKSSYYFMFPFRKYLNRKFRESLREIAKDNLSDELREIKEVFLRKK